MVGRSKAVPPLSSIGLWHQDAALRASAGIELGSRSLALSTSFVLLACLLGL
jgi:hypothetical protein